MLKRIYWLIAAILLVSMLLAGGIAFSIMNSYNRETTDNRLDSAIRLFAYEIGQGKTYAEAADRVGLVFSSDTEQIRITVVETNGDVLFDNESDNTFRTNHLDRPEIRQAIDSRASGQSIRESATLRIRIYYYAEYDAQLDVVIRAALPLNIYIRNLRSMEVRLALVLAATLLAFATVGILAARAVARPLFGLKAAADRMAGGDYSARVPRSGRGRTEIGDLSAAFNKMAQKQEDVIGEIREKNLRMDTVLNSIGSPIIAVDENLAVTFYNHSILDDFDVPPIPAGASCPFISIVRSAEAEEWVRRALASGEGQTGQVRIGTRAGTRLYRMSVFLAPVSGSRGAIALFQDITEIHRLQKMRSDFVANVTHELKTPLTSIRGFVDTLRSGNVRDRETTDRFLEIIDIEAERLYKLISDILSLSEIEEMKTDTDCADFDLYPLIDEVIVMLDEEAVARNVSILVEEGFSEEPFPDPPSVGADRGNAGADSEPPLILHANRNRIKQVLINLIENAVRYNNPGGRVYVSACRDSEGQVRIRVRDNGNGIPAEHLPRIFERFYRVDKGRSRELGGTGLGLSIVKHIAMLYGGEVHAESVVGQGSVFTVTLKV